MIATLRKEGSPGQGLRDVEIRLPENVAFTPGEVLSATIASGTDDRLTEAFVAAAYESLWVPSLALDVPVQILDDSVPRFFNVGEKIKLSVLRH